MPEFPIRRVDPVRREAFEALGTKRKFWFRDGGRWLLFKAEDRGTGDDWAEVISSHLCALLGLPHVQYELATGRPWGCNCGLRRLVDPGPHGAGWRRLN